MDRETFIDQINEHLKEVFFLAVHHIKYDDPSGSKRSRLFNQLLDIQQLLNGIESDDLV